MLHILGSLVGFCNHDNSVICYLLDVSQVIIYMALYKMLCRRQEKEADIQAALKLQSVQGGVKLFFRCKEREQAIKEYIKNLSGVRGFVQILCSGCSPFGSLHTLPFKSVLTIYTI